MRADPAHEVEASSLGLLERRRRAAWRREHRSALADDAREQSLGERGGHERARRLRTGGLARDRDLVGIAAEGRNVALDPHQRCDEVVQAVIAGRAMLRLGGEFGMREKTKRVETMIDGDDDDAAPGQTRAVIAWLGAGADDEAAAVNPNHYRQTRACPGSGRRPGVEVKAILGGCGSSKVDVVPYDALHGMGPK